jgi:hypothetical protein
MLTTQASAIQKDNHRMEKPGFIDRAGFSLRPLVNEMVQKAGPAADPWSSGTEAKGSAHQGHAPKAGDH